MRWRWLSLLVVTSCVAVPTTVDGGGSPDDVCKAAGGVCSDPEACLEQVGDITCLGTSVCCITSPSSDAGASPSDAPRRPAPLPPVPLGVDASLGGGRSTASCDLACEAECVGDPNCVEACGC